MAASKVLKWGNSLALRIPAAFAKDARLEEGGVVDVRLEGGKIVVEPVIGVGLDRLLDAITDDNRHGEVSTGKPRGNEAW